MNKNKRSFIAVLTIILLLCIGIGYAYLETDLKINSSVHLKKGDKCKNITNAVQKVRCIAESDTTNLVADDETDDHNTRYIGKNPNNYVKFNDELWRIIGVFNNIDDGTGKKETRVKIVRNESLGNYSWDTSESSVNDGFGVNEWSQSDLMKELNTDYLGNVTIGTDGYWYNYLNNKKTATMPTTVLSKNSQSMIDNAVWYTGTFLESTTTEKNPKNFYTAERSNNTGKQCEGGDPADPFYNPECSDAIERTTTWTGKIALIYPSDYGFATSGGTTTNRIKCLEKDLSSWEDSDSSYSECINNTYLYKDKTLHTITPKSSTWNSDSVYQIKLYIIGKATDTSAVYPSLYLKASVSITGGNGTSSNPFTLSEK